jgi:hypothetical protein
VTVAWLECDLTRASFATCTTNSLVICTTKPAARPLLVAFQSSCCVVMALHAGTTAPGAPNASCLRRHRQNLVARTWRLLCSSVCMHAELSRLAWSVSCSASPCSVYADCDAAVLRAWRRPFYHAWQSRLRPPVRSPLRPEASLTTRTIARGHPDSMRSGVLHQVIGKWYTTRHRPAKASIGQQRTAKDSKGRQRTAKNSKE